MRNGINVISKDGKTQGIALKTARVVKGDQIITKTKIRKSNGTVIWIKTDNLSEHPQIKERPEWNLTSSEKKVLEVLNQHGLGANFQMEEALSKCLSSIEDMPRLEALWALEKIHNAVTTLHLGSRENSLRTSGQGIQHVSRQSWYNH